MAATIVLDFLLLLSLALTFARSSKPLSSNHLDLLQKNLRTHRKLHRPQFDRLIVRFDPRFALAALIRIRGAVFSGDVLFCHQRGRNQKKKAKRANCRRRRFPPFAFGADLLYYSFSSSPRKR